MRGLATEVAKNIVLAGIGSLTILDSDVVVPSDLGAQFFLRESDIGKNRAESSVERVRELNPSVEVTAETRHVSSCDQAFIEQFDVVCLVDTAPQDAIRVNNMCRAAKKDISFFTAASFGWYCYFFVDLQEYALAPSSSSSPSSAPTSSSAASPVAAPKILSYSSLQDTLQLSGDKLGKCFGRRYRAQESMWAAITRIVQFHLAEDRAATMADLAQLEALQTEATQKVLRSVVPLLGCELPPVCAIFGGLLGCV